LQWQETGQVITPNQSATCPIVAKTTLMQQSMEGIRKGLILARTAQLSDASPQNPIQVTRQSISAFHHDVFIANGAAANAFGGDLWDLGAPVSTYFYDWCESPACR
jgi:hypothetical protein